MLPTAWLGSDFSVIEKGLPLLLSDLANFTITLALQLPKCPSCELIYTNGPPLSDFQSY